jgi:hypothetical protein
MSSNVSCISMSLNALLALYHCFLAISKYLSCI